MNAVRYAWICADRDLVARRLVRLVVRSTASAAAAHNSGEGDVPDRLLLHPLHVRLDVAL